MVLREHEEDALRQTLQKLYQDSSRRKYKVARFHSGEPVTDNIDALASIRLCHAGSVKKEPVGLYIATEKA